MTSVAASKIAALALLAGCLLIYGGMKYRDETDDRAWPSEIENNRILAKYGSPQQQREVAQADEKEQQIRDDRSTTTKGLAGGGFVVALAAALFLGWQLVLLMIRSAARAARAGSRP